ncbi:MAG: transporter [Legionellales bacterium RIFCSPHIGHO2_12_FULL_42_9]|nr:MAG: transporter [Legionellales bacterium RIFCSPHIGHO2_12_FULL_42_9]
MRALSNEVFNIVTLIACLLISACMVGPNYHEPPKKIAANWLYKGKAIRTRHIENANWWNVFHDPILTALIYYGYKNNLNLQSAGVRVLQARAQLAQTVGELYPQQQNLIGNFTDNRIGGTSLQSVLPTYFDTALLGANATWELDFWGKYRRAILSNNAAFLASYAAYDSALVSLTSDIATAYINIRTTEEFIAVTQANIRIQTTAFKLSQARFNAGQISLLDVEQSQTELAQTQSTLPEFISILQREKDTLAVLLGTTPDQVNGLLIPKKGIPHTQEAVVIGIPKETIAKRPDIYQARMAAIAQAEAIGATKANLYPAFSLTGTFALASNNIGASSLNDLFNWSSRTTTSGPAFNWPILNYGQLTNAVRIQDAVFQEALLQYLNLVLQAQKEVQDNITRVIEARKSEHYLMVASQAAIKSTQLAMIRYKEGESDYTPVLNSERQQLRVQLSLTQRKGDIPKALVALYRALGGGWQVRGCNDVVPAHIKKDMAARTYWGTLLQQQNHKPPITKQQSIKNRYLPNW